MNKLKNLNFINESLGAIKTAELDIESIKHLIKLDKAIKEEVETFTNAQVRIFKDFDVKPDENGRYNWSIHENAEKIAEKLNELYNSEFEVNPSNFLTEDDFFKSTKGFNINQLSVLMDILCKKEL